MIPVPYLSSLVPSTIHVGRAVLSSVVKRDAVPRGPNPSISVGKRNVLYKQDQTRQYQLGNEMVFQQNKPRQ